MLPGSVRHVNQQGGAAMAGDPGAGSSGQRQRQTFLSPLQAARDARRSSPPPDDEVSDMHAHHVTSIAPASSTAEARLKEDVDAAGIALLRLQKDDPWVGEAHAEAK